MNSPLTYGSVCSGMEAATLAFAPLGWRCAFVSEIEKAPCALLAQRYPDVPNFGDMTKFEEWPDVAIDVLAGGTPCQSFSVAGLRKGLTDPRGSLMLVYGAIAQRYRPTWLLWENVPGVLSSNGGRDFGAFLGMLAELGYGFAYRVLDAQFFGLAQRRARVFVVGYLGNWRPPAAVLFEPESLRGDSPPRRETGEGIAPTISARTKGGGGLGTDAECDGALIAKALTAHPSRIDGETETFVAHALTGEGFDASEDGRALAFTLHGADKTVSTATQTDIAGSVRTKPPGSIENSSTTVALQDYAVRRLTPRECERLQGALDDYTLATYRKRPMADGPRYKMIGNSWAVPCVRWIGERIALVDARLKAADGARCNEGEKQ